MSEAQRLAAFLTSPLGQFRSWRTPDGTCPQGAFLRAFQHSRKIVFRAGNRSGKTSVGAVAADLLLCGQHPWVKRPGPIHGWISCLSWDFCAEVVWPKVKELLPMALVAGITYRRRSAPEIPNQIVMRDGSTATFKSAEQKRAKYQGAKLDWLWFDEEHPAEIVEEGRARLIDNAGHLFVTLTPVMRARWVSQLEREPGTVVIRASMIQAAEAGILPMEEVLAYAAALPERQRRVRVGGEFVALEGIVYPDFARTTHCARPEGNRLVLGDVSWPWPLPEAWRRRAAIDFGFANPTAVLLACEDPFHSRLIVERCLYSAGIRATVWARHVKRLFPQLCRAMVADHDAFARADFEHEGVATTAANKAVDNGIEAFDRLLQPCGDGAPGLVLVIDPTLTDGSLGRVDADKLAWELEGYHYAAQKIDAPDVKDAPVKSDDHACDAGRYLVKDWEDNRHGAPQPPTTRHRGREATAISLGHAEDDWD